LAVLEESRLVTASRATNHGRPQTVVVMTSAGRRRFQQYLNVLEQVLTDAAANPSQAAVRPGRVVPRIAPA
jgi:predicted MarR family transcription regulator